MDKAQCLCPSGCPCRPLLLRDALSHLPLPPPRGALCPLPPLREQSFALHSRGPSPSPHMQEMAGSCKCSIETEKDASPAPMSPRPLPRLQSLHLQRLLSPLLLQASRLQLLCRLPRRCGRQKSPCPLRLPLSLAPRAHPNCQLLLT